MKDELADKLVTDLHMVNSTLNAILDKSPRWIAAFVMIADAIDSIEDAISEVKTE